MAPHVLVLYFLLNALGCCLGLDMRRMRRAPLARYMPRATRRPPSLVRRRSKACRICLVQSRRCLIRLVTADSHTHDAYI